MAGVVVTRGRKPAEDEGARTSMRRGRRREETAEDMAGEEMPPHHEATVGDTQAKVDRLGLTWGEEGVGLGAQIQVVSIAPFFPRKRLLIMSRRSCAKTDAWSGSTASGWAGAAVCWRGYKWW